MAYATTTDLAAYLGGEPLPDNPAVLLERASVDVDDLLIGAYYRTDGSDLPTDPKIAEALKLAACAQVHYWMETGNTSGVDTAGGWRDVSIGNVRMSRSAGGSGQEGSATAFSPAGIKILRLAGLLPVSPWVYG